MPKLKLAAGRCLSFVRRKPAPCAIVLIALALAGNFVLSTWTAHRNTAYNLTEVPGTETSLSAVYRAYSKDSVYISEAFSSYAYQSWREVLISPVVCVESLPEGAAPADGWQLPFFSVYSIDSRDYADLVVSVPEAYTYKDEAYAVVHLGFSTGSYGVANVYRFEQLSAAALEEHCRRAAAVDIETNGITVNYTSLAQLVSDSTLGAEFPTELPEGVEFESAFYYRHSILNKISMTCTAGDEAFTITVRDYPVDIYSGKVSENHDIEELTYEDFSRLVLSSYADAVGSELFPDMSFACGDVHIRVGFDNYRSKASRQATYELLLSFCEQKGE